MNNAVQELLQFLGAAYVPAALFVFWYTFSKFKLDVEIDDERLAREAGYVPVINTKEWAIFLSHILIPGWNVLIALLCISLEAMEWAFDTFLYSHPDDENERNIS